MRTVFLSLLHFNFQGGNLSPNQMNSFAARVDHPQFRHEIIRRCCLPNKRPLQISFSRDLHPHREPLDFNSDAR